MENNTFKINQAEVNSFHKLQKHIMDFVSNYLDDYQKRKFFYINVRNN